MKSHALFLTLTPNIIHKAVIVSNHYFYRLFLVRGSTASGMPLQGVILRFKGG